MPTYEVLGRPDWPVQQIVAEEAAIEEHRLIFKNKGRVVAEFMVWYYYKIIEEAQGNVQAGGV